MLIGLLNLEFGHKLQVYNLIKNLMDTLDTRLDLGCGIRLPETARHIQQPQQQSNVEGQGLRLDV